STVGCFRFRRRSHERLGLAVVAGARSDRAGSDRVADSGRSTRDGPASAPAAGRPGPTRVDQAVSDASGPPIGPVVAGSSSAGPIRGGTSPGPLSRKPAEGRSTRGSAGRPAADQGSGRVAGGRGSAVGDCGRVAGPGRSTDQESNENGAGLSSVGRDGVEVSSPPGRELASGSVVPAAGQAGEEPVGGSVGRSNVDRVPVPSPASGSTGVPVADPVPGRSKAGNGSVGVGVVGWSGPVSGSVSGSFRGSVSGSFRDPAPGRSSPASPGQAPIESESVGLPEPADASAPLVVDPLAVPVEPNPGARSNP